MSKTIIGIHGLANKPPKEDLKKWWKNAIQEGLRVNCEVEQPEFDFRPVYWADLLHKNPLHDDKNFAFDDLYNREPYQKADPRDLKDYKTSWLDRVRAEASDIVGTSVDALKRHVGMDSFADWVLGRLLKDLAFYYDDERTIQNRARPPQLELARKVLRDDLKNALIVEKDKEILLIAHSMGSIIAYDVLRDLGRTGEDVEVAHFVTIGSPLGLPHVKGEIVKERRHDPKVRTPSIVSKSWVNYADRKDPVAVDIHLRDDYRANNSDVRVRDDLVINDYRCPGDGKRNHHKSYGYLRTPELSRQIQGFLGI